MTATETAEGEFAEFVQWLKQEYAPQAIYLFGSRARGDAIKESDYDLLIVSSAFEGVMFTDRMTRIYAHSPRPGNLECLCLTPSEFERSRNMISLVALIAREGVLV